jgi:TRAP transporter TAXI family solute receptor
MNPLPRRVARLAVVTVIGALALTSCGGKRDADTAAGGATGGRLTIATGNTTGVYYQLGGGLAKLISENLDGFKATASETGASAQNIQGLVSGNYDIGFSLMDTAGDAVTGNGPFSAPQPVEALTRLYPNYTQVIVRSGSGISSVADMRGKRVSTGSPNSGTEVIARRLLEAAGLDPAKDVRAQRLGLPETVDAMKDGTVDALFWSGGLPTGGITDLTTSLKGGVKFLDVTPLLGTLQQDHGKVYESGMIPAATYGQPANVPTIVVPNVLLVKKGFDATLAEQIVKLIYEKKADLENVHPAAKDVTAEIATKTDPVTLNPGAQQALEELATPS